MAIEQKPIPQPTSIIVIPGLSVWAEDLVWVMKQAAQRIVDELSAPPDANVRASQTSLQGSKYESNTRTFFQLSLFSSMNFRCRSAFAYWS